LASLARSPEIRIAGAAANDSGSTCFPSRAACVQPLLTLSAVRIQDELARAAAIAADAAAYRQKTVRLILVCIADYVAGLAIIGFSLHMSDGDLAPVLFYAGLLRALCGPMWTVLLTLWLEENG